MKKAFLLLAVFLLIATSARSEVLKTDSGHGYEGILFQNNSGGSLQLNVPSGDIGTINRTITGLGTNGQLDITGSLTGSTSTNLISATNSAASAANTVTIGVAGDVTNTGAASGGTGHLIGTWGRATEGTSGAFTLMGAEGRVDGRSNVANTYYGLVSYVLWQGAGTLSDSSTFAGLRIQRELTTDGNTANPKSNGNSYGIDIANAVGSKNNFGIYVEPQSGGSTANVGIAVGAATTATLWLNSNADPTTAAGGIYFGSSLDTDLYRSAAGTLTTDVKFTSKATSDIGWSIQSAANQACNTTCTHACVFGQETTSKAILACTDATADTCLCAGAN